LAAPHLQRGNAAEKLARRWLQQRGLRHLESNFRCKLGELDLIMLEGECLVIVEVRYRASQQHGGALHSVTLRKQQRIMKTTSHYLQRRKQLTALPLRFDVLAISGALTAPHVDWCKQAFDAGG